MSRRIVIEEPCEHGKFLRHRDTPDQFCPGGSRTVFEGLPEDMTDRAKDAFNRTWSKPAVGGTEGVDGLGISLRAALEAALGLGHDQ